MFISFKYSIRALQSFKRFKCVPSLLLINNWYFASYRTLAYKNFLSISFWWIIRLNNELVSPNLQLLIFCMDDQEFVANLDYAFWYFFIVSPDLIIFVLFHYIITINLFFPLTRYLLFHTKRFLLHFFYHHLNLKQSY